MEYVWNMAQLHVPWGTFPSYVHTYAHKCIHTYISVHMYVHTGTCNMYGEENFLRTYVRTYVSVLCIQWGYMNMIQYIKWIYTYIYVLLVADQKAISLCACLHDACMIYRHTPTYSNFWCCPWFWWLQVFPYQVGQLLFGHIKWLTLLACILSAHLLMTLLWWKATQVSIVYCLCVHDIKLHTNQPFINKLRQHVNCSH